MIKIELISNSRPDYHLFLQRYKNIMILCLLMSIYIGSSKTLGTPQKNLVVREISQLLTPTIQSIVVFCLDFSETLFLIYMSRKKKIVKVNTSRSRFRSAMTHALPCSTRTLTVLPAPTQNSQSTPLTTAIARSLCLESPTLLEEDSQPQVGTLKLYSLWFYTSSGLFDGGYDIVLDFYL